MKKLAILKTGKELLKITLYLHNIEDTISVSRKKWNLTCVLQGRLLKHQADGGHFRWEVKTKSKIRAMETRTNIAPGEDREGREWIKESIVGGRDSDK